ncbi:MAG: hypothetical protein JXA01_03770 [Dehalococcoidia bacterium]|nr:hypothetical protein [Dehalococcoidia bacterium]
MSRKIENAFNDCFERLLSGESLDSCLSSYPEYAGELDSMLRTMFDIKRTAYPIQPRPEFKYWARVRMQGIQQTNVPKGTSDKVSSFNIRRNLAISLAALLVFVMASTGTVAASSNAMPDQPLYNVKLAVEQVQLTFTASDIAKAELHANLAEKRANEIAVMAKQGNTEKVISTKTKMYYQLDQAEQLIAGIDASIKESNEGALSLPASTVITKPVTPTNTANTTAPAASSTASTNNTSEQQTDSKSDTSSSRQISRSISAANKAKVSINASTAKTITILQDALDNAPDSVKPSLNAIIEHTKTTNARINKQIGDSKQDGSVSDNTSTETDRNIKNKPRIVMPSDNSSKTSETQRINTYHKYEGKNSGSGSNNTGNSENQSSSTTNTTGENTTSVINTRTITTDTLKPITTSPTDNIVDSTNRDTTTSNTTSVTGKTVIQTDILR